MCRRCGLLLQYYIDHCDELDVLCRLESRIVSFHTMEHGTIYITVLDLRCPYCNELNLFEGEPCGMFSLSENVMFMCELLDYFMYLVCGMALNFREAFEVDTRLNQTQSPKVIQHGRATTCRRRATNRCFSLYLKTLVCPSKEALPSLFSCGKCEYK